MEEIERKVRGIIAEVLGLEESLVSREADFAEDLGADSLTVLELLLALQREFRCEIPDDEARRITTVRQAVEYVGSRAA